MRLVIDCYRILGVPPDASQAAIRAAYLARMKTLHPDAASPREESEVTAADVTFAYAQLRDPVRRASHDQRLRTPATPLRKAPGKPSQRGGGHRRRMPLRVHERRTARLRPLRSAAGAVAFVVAAAGFAVAFGYLQPPGAGGAQAATLAVAGNSAEADLVPTRRRLDPLLTEAASEEFRGIVRSEGRGAVNIYARQCMAELRAAPTLSLLDYCIAFDNAGADWERAAGGEGGENRFFNDEGRFVRYKAAADSLRNQRVRSALLEEARYFADRSS